MNIALIGAPGSGKSKLATQVANELDSCWIVDDYISEIEEETDLALGSIADYLGNLYVALGRYQRERIARKRMKNVITCGTLIETAVYIALHTAASAEVLTEEVRAEYAPRLDAIMRLMSCLYADIFSYDHVFYLPARTGGEENKFIDRQVQAALGGFKLVDYVQLSEENQFEVVMEKLR